MTTTFSMHRRLPANTRGYDYLVGDLHGCLDLLDDELARVQFNPAIDRLISVGDLVDRGPDSLGCLRLLKEPWFHAVRGNHEDMMCEGVREAAFGVPTGSTRDLIHNGGAWLFDLTPDEKRELSKELMPYVRALPYVLTVGDGDAQFHVAHAELMDGFSDAFMAFSLGHDQKPRILTDRQITEKKLSTMTDPLLWGRRLIATLPKHGKRMMPTPEGSVCVSESAMHPGLSLTYVGHTPLLQMVLHESHLFIDRGAYARSEKTRLLVLCHDDVLKWLTSI